MPEHTECEIRYELDMWGNPWDGFDCNNISGYATLQLNPECTDLELVQALIDRGILNSDCIVNGQIADWLYIDDNTIYERVPLGEYAHCADGRADADAHPFIPIVFIDWF